jgi:hypothetical protein
VDGAKGPLALKMPDSFDDAYQVFVNGQRIGEFGKFTEHGVIAYSGLPTDFPLPKGVREGRISIAIRVWMDSATPFNSADAGGLRQPPELGHASAISDQVRLDWDDVGHYVGSAFLEMLILVMALIMALSLFWLDRQEKSYLWLALVCEATMLSVGLVLLVNFTTWIGQTTDVVLTDVIAIPLRIGCGFCSGGTGSDWSGCISCIVWCGRWWLSLPSELRCSGHLYMGHMFRFILRCIWNLFC